MDSALTSITMERPVLFACNLDFAFGRRYILADFEVWVTIAYGELSVVLESASYAARLGFCEHEKPERRNIRMHRNLAG